MILQSFQTLCGNDICQRTVNRGNNMLSGLGGMVLFDWRATHAVCSVPTLLSCFQIEFSKQIGSKNKMWANVMRWMANPVQLCGWHYFEYSQRISTWVVVVVRTAFTIWSGADASNGIKTIFSSHISMRMKKKHRNKWSIAVFMGVKGTYYTL